MLSEHAIRQMFQQTGAMLEGHFLLSSGLHSTSYLQCALVLQDPVYAELLGFALAEKLYTHFSGIDFIIGPALGGIVIAHEVARGLGKITGKKTKSLFAERQAGRMMLRRGFQIRPEERGIIVEDVITTGKSSQETIEVVRSLGGRAVAVGAIINRSAAPLALPTPLISLLDLRIENYDPEKCPLCGQSVPFVKPGSRG